MEEEPKEWRHVERIINNLNQHWHSIQLLLGHVSKPLLVDDRGLRQVIHDINSNLRSTIDQIKDLDLARINGEIKYIGSRLNSIEQLLSSLKEEGISKKIELDFVVDGYTMVKKPKQYDKSDSEELPIDYYINSLLNSLKEKEKNILIHRFGLNGEKKKTLRETGYIFNLSGERARAIQMRALRSCRHAARKDLVAKIKGTSLHKAIVNS